MSLSHHTSEAERMAELFAQLDEAWCCLICYAKFSAGAMPYNAFHCPHCSSNQVHPINRPPITLTEYHGVIGWRS